MKPTDNGYILSTGRELYANLQEIGLAFDSDELTEGSDGVFYDPNAHEFNEYAKQLSPFECAEIADYMIDLWTKWKEKYGKVDDEKRS